MMVYSASRMQYNDLSQGRVRDGDSFRRRHPLCKYLILFVLIVVGLGLTVLIFVILLKASKLLSLMIDKAKKGQSAAAARITGRLTVSRWSFDMSRRGLRSCPFNGSWA
jgi:hypothetical protein